MRRDGRLPIGAECLPERRRRISASGRRAPARRRGARDRRRRGRGSRWRAEDERLLLGLRRRGAARARSTASGSTATSTSIPIPPRASSPRARTARRGSSIPRRSAGPTPAGRARRSAGRSSTRCTSARSRRRAPGRRRRASCRSWRDLGVTCIEVMPVAEFPGRFGWGYDGVNLFAPTRLYGAPDDLRRFVDEAHAHGLAVILDVVYNHLGPDGNYLRAVLRQTTSPTGTRPTGARRSTSTARLRAGARVLPRQRGLLDRRVPPRRPAARRHAEHLRRRPTSTSSPRSRARCARRRAGRDDDHRRRERAAGDAPRAPAGARRLRARRAVERRLPPHRDGRAHRQRRGLLHRLPRHAAGVRSRPRSAAILYQGQRYKWQRQRRGTPALDLPPAAFVTFIENHDQVANSARGAARAPARRAPAATAR